MATINTTKKRAKRKVKAAPKAADHPVIEKIEPAVTSEGPSLSAADIDAIAKRMAELMKPAPVVEEVKEAGIKVVAAANLETAPLTAEQAAAMTPEQVADYNQKEQAKLTARKKAQAEKRKGLEGLSTGERIKALQADRDPNVIRVAVDPGYDGDDYVRVECLKKIGLDTCGTMSDILEEVDMPRHAAKRLVESGAVRVAI